MRRTPLLVALATLGLCALLSSPLATRAEDVGNADAAIRAAERRRHGDFVPRAPRPEIALPPSTIDLTTDGAHRVTVSRDHVFWLAPETGATVRKVAVHYPLRSVDLHAGRVYVMEQPVFGYGRAHERIQVWPAQGETQTHQIATPPVATRQSASAGTTMRTPWSALRTPLSVKLRSGRLRRSTRIT